MTLPESYFVCKSIPSGARVTVYDAQGKQIATGDSPLTVRITAHEAYSILFEIDLMVLSLFAK